MKNIIILALVILGMTSCKTTQTKVLVGHQDVPTNKCLVDQEILTNKVDSRGNLILDSKGDPIKIGTGKYRKVEVPCFRLDSTFVAVDTNSDGRDDTYAFLRMDTIYLANAVTKEETTVPNEIIRPNQKVGTNVVTTNGAIYTRTRPTAGYYRYYYGFSPYYSPRHWWRFWWW